MNKDAFIVTGARTGIGRATTQRLLSEGFQVVGISRKISSADFEDAKFFPLQADLAQLDTLKPTIKKAIELVGGKNRLRGAVWCAGKGLFGSLEQLSASSIRALIDLNLNSPMLLSQLLVPVLKTNKMGHLVFIGSEAALRGGQKGTIYCASKFGLRGFTQALKAEVSSSGVKVTLINPGMVDTPFFDQLAFKPGDAIENSISMETVAAAIYWAIESPQETQIDEINLSPLKNVIEFK